MWLLHAFALCGLKYLLLYKIGNSYNFYIKRNVNDILNIYKK